MYLKTSIFFNVWHFLFMMYTFFRQNNLKSLCFVPSADEFCEMQLKAMGLVVLSNYDFQGQQWTSILKGSIL